MVAGVVALNTGDPRGVALGAQAQASSLLLYGNHLGDARVPTAKAFFAMEDGPAKAR